VACVPPVPLTALGMSRICTAFPILPRRANARADTYEAEGSYHARGDQATATHLSESSFTGATTNGLAASLRWRKDERL